MTSDTPDQSTGTSGTAPRRATRRRVTRPTSAPQAPPEPIVVPQAAPGAAEPEQPVTSAAPQRATSTEPAASTPARRPRRATRRTAGPAAAPAETAPAETASTETAPQDVPGTEPAEVAPAPTAAAGDSAASATDADAGAGAGAGASSISLPPAAAASDTDTTEAPLSLDDIVLPGGPASERRPGDGEEESAAPRRSRRSGTKSATSKGATSKGATSKGATSKGTSKGKTSKSDEAADATSKDSTEETAAAPTAGAEAASTTRGSRRASTRSARTESTKESSTAGQAGTPRLATTALLFQAPDLTGTRASRRAQAPAGPARPHDEPASDGPAEDTTSAAPAADAAEPTRETPGGGAAKGTEKPAKKATSKSRKPARDEATGSDGAAAQATTETPGTPEAGPLDLGEADVAAVDELEVIESELTAEGLELVELGPEDFREDGDEGDIRPRRRRRRGGRGRRGGRRGDRPQGSESAASGDDGESTDGPRGDESEGDRPQNGPAEPGDGETVPEDASSTPSGSTSSGEQSSAEQSSDDGDESDDRSSSSRRRRRRRRGGRGGDREAGRPGRAEDEVVALKGSTRLEAKRQRRREGRDAGRRRQVITEAEFLARRESVSRSMIVREQDARTQIAVLEDGVLVEHYVSQQAQASMVGNVYLGRVQNVLPSMEAAFVDVGKGRNAVLYAGEVNWDAAGIEGQPRRIEEALKSGDSVLVQVTKDPIGHKGARLTSQVTLAGRYLVFVPGGGMTGISRKLPDTERNRLKKILRDVVPDGAGVIVRTAAEGASEEELRADVERLQSQWQSIDDKAAKSSTSAPALLQGEADMAIRVVRDIFNDDFASLVVEGDRAWSEISTYVEELAPDLRERVSRWTGAQDVFAVHRVDEQLAKGMDRKVWLPSGGSLVIDRTEAMTVVDVNTGKFTGSGGTLEETVTRNNLEAAEEIVRQLRLRDIGGIIVIDFVDMVLESNRDLVLRRLVECLGRDRTKHQVAEVTSLGLVQMTRKRVGQGLVEAFSSTCEHCKGRGFIVHEHPVEKSPAPAGEGDGGSKRSRRKRGGAKKGAEESSGSDVPKLPDDKSKERAAVKATLATIAAAAAHAHEHEDEDRSAASGAEAADASAAATADVPESTPVSPDPEAPEPTVPVAEAPADAPRAGSTPDVVEPEPAAEPETAAEPESADADAAQPAAEPADPPRSEPARADEPAKGAGAEEAPEQVEGEAAAVTEKG
ncbi:hypothetical protein GCM10023216_29340 [Isoptericola chiayiensis]|uniref:S1 motif domain-containing protein n=1 Tax=Isoptericola chiayiensis TaxID=579446 RepID=A0ABP8YMU6_9MICO